MKKNWWSIIICGAVLSSMIGGCSSASQVAEEAPAAGTENTRGTSEASGGDLSGKEVVFIIKNLTTPFFLSMKEGAEDAGRDFGIKVTVQAPTSTEEGAGNEEQTQLIEQAIANKAAAVCIAPTDSNGIIPAVKKLIEAGIPVVASNTKIAEEGLSNCFVGLENYTQGYNVAKELCEGLGGKGRMFIIEGTAGAQTSIDRVAGATAAIAEYPDIEIAAQQSASYKRASAMDVVQNLLQTNPDVNAIYCCNDEMALGAVEAVDAAGKTGQILIGGADGNADALQAIIDGKMYTTAEANAHDQAYYSVEAAVMILKGETGQDKLIQSPVITKDNAEEFKK
ncbi:sugar ABC transporter substrate-binding protein [Lachnospiraceae bacterium 54-53]